MIERNTVPVIRTDEGVWMLRDGSGVSLSRAIAVHAMRALRLDAGDFRKRDRIIQAISDVVNGALDYVRDGGE